MEHNPGRVYEITTGTQFFYLGGEKIGIFSEIDLFDDVAPAALQKAAEFMLESMPFFNVTPAVSDGGDRYILKTNPEAFRVVESEDFVSCYDERAEGYLFTIGYHGSRIRICVFHGLTDGLGAMRLVQALLKAYFEILSGDGTALPAPFDPGSELDPYTLITECEPSFRLRKKQGFSFTSEQADETNIRLYRLRLPEQPIVEYAKKSEGGVSGLLALAVARSVDAMYSGIEESILVSCPMDMRGLLGCPKVLRNCTKSSKYEFSAAMRKMPVDMQLSCLKGQMMIQSSGEYQLIRLRNDKRELSDILRLGSIEEKERYYNASSGLKGEPIVSYLGKFDIGEYNRHIKNLSFFGEVVGLAGIQNVAVCFNGECILSVSCNLRNEQYCDYLAKEYANLGFSCSEPEQIEYHKLQRGDI